MEKYISTLPDKELDFARPFTSTTTQTINLTNSSSSEAVVAFKVKTTAPKQYCVRPNSGILNPHESISVTVLLQAMKADPPADFVCKDKFLIQFIKIPADILREIGDDPASPRLIELWNQTEVLKRSVPDAQMVVYEKKLRCTFSGPGGSDISSLLASPNRASSPSGRALGSADDGADEFGSVKNLADSPTTSSPSSGPGTMRGGVEAARSAPSSSLFTAKPVHASDLSPDSPPSRKISATAGSGAPAGSASLADKELREAKDKIKSLQTACDVYKAEIERINALRVRKAQDMVPTSSSFSSASSSKKSGSTIATKLFMIFVAIFSFCVGYYFKTIGY